MTSVLQNAMDWALLNRSDSSSQHRAAFANSVAYLVTGESGGYGGPSIREHLCSHALAGDGEVVQTILGNKHVSLIIPDGRIPHSGQWEFEKAIAFCDPICFGILSRLSLKIVVVEYCFDDDPQDLLIVEDWELEELKALKDRKRIKKLPQQDWMRLRYLESKHSK